MVMDMEWEDGGSNLDFTMDLSNIPIVILENILSYLTDPVSQRRLEQVGNQYLKILLKTTSLLRCVNCGARL